MATSLRRTVEREGRTPARGGAVALVAAVAIGLAFGLGAFTFVYARGASYLTNDPAACANCHVMQEHFDAWNKSSHKNVAACNDCHAPHNVVGKYYTKALNGFWHSVYFTTGRYPDPLRITERNRRVTEGACRYCHSAITDAIDPTVAAHGAPVVLRSPALATLPVMPNAVMVALAQGADKGAQVGGAEGSGRAGAMHGGTNDQQLSCIRCHKYVGHWVR